MHYPILRRRFFVCPRAHRRGSEQPRPRRRAGHDQFDGPGLKSAVLARHARAAILDVLGEDYPRLLLSRWDQGAGLVPELKVFGPPPIARMTEQLFGESGVYADDIRARTQHQGSIDIFEARGGVAPRLRPAPEVRELEPGDVIRGDGWTLGVAEGWHVQPYLRCCGYRIEADGQVLCYSGDSGGVCPEIVELARGADVLIHMMHYYSGTEPTEIYRKVCGNHIDTATVARDAGVKTLVLTHMLEQIDQPGIRERIIREMGRIFDGTIIWGEDLLRIPMGGASLAKMD